MGYHQRMRVILLCLNLILIVSATSRRTSSGRRLTATRRRFLSQNMQMDMEERRNRLQALSATPTCQKLLKTGISVVPKTIDIVNVESSSDNSTLDLFHLNEEQGSAEYFFQGDMHLTDEQLTVIEMEMNKEDDSNTRRKRQASIVFRKWTDNTLFYYFDSGVTQRVRDSVAAALSEMTSKTCINFVQSSTAQNRVKIFMGPGCFATVGMAGGEQQLSLGFGCEVVGTAAHEFSHALGIFHTQMRSDRDNFVTVNNAAIQPRLVGNFIKLSSNQIRSYTPYEYGSMMHYPADAFAERGQVSLISKDSRFMQTMGNRMISFYDIQTLNDHYGCSARCSPRSSALCRNGGVPNPRNCAICNCPSGYSGTLCDQRPPGCGENLPASAQWQSKTYSYGNNTSQVVRDVFSLCNHWITAPTGRVIQVKVTSMFNSQCNFGCAFNGVEIKLNTNQQETNPRICCESSQNQIFTSQVNPTPIVSFNRFFFTTFTIEYRHVAANSVSNEDSENDNGPISTTASSRPPLLRRTRRPFTRFGNRRG